VDSERFVVRVYSTNSITADLECDLLRFLASSEVLVPAVLARSDVQEHAVAVIEFIDGITLEDRLLNGPPPPPTLYHQIGAQLAKISFMRRSGPSGYAEPVKVFDNLYFVGQKDEYSAWAVSTSQGPHPGLTHCGITQ